ncbi:MAG: DUF721 domain-containing protein [Nocardioidaceae bacterium]|nr:DUF721 domain-containing protein [Nocardioidaceae bacterium]
MPESSTGSGPQSGNSEDTEAVKKSAPESPSGTPPAEGSVSRASEHEPTGLDLARSTAAAVRGSAAQRPSYKWGRSRRPETAELSGSHPDGRDPMTLSASLERLVTDSGWAADVAVRAVFARWPEIVGAEVAAHCQPETYRDGHLTIRTDSTAWATQMRLLAPQVVRRMNEELGDASVLRIDVQGPEGPSWRRGPRSVRGARGPRDTYG